MLPIGNQAVIFVQIVIIKPISLVTNAPLFHGYSMSTCKLNMFNSENRFKNRPKAKSADFLKILKNR